MRIFGDILAGHRPVSIHLGRVPDGALKDVTGLAGDRIQVDRNALVIMDSFAMAVCAGDLVLVVDANRNRVPFDLVILGLVAVNAQEVMTAHVNIHIFRREEKAAVQVAVFDGVSAATVKVTTAAIGPGGRAYTLGDGCQIHAAIV